MRARRVTVGAAVFALLALLAWATPAYATAIRQPSTSPYVVAADSAGRPVAFTVVASGFRPGSLAYVEQCDGAPLGTPGWSPTVHCDLGSAPAPAIVAHDGTATFDARTANHRFTPFRGESPQSLFNCLAAHDATPSNGLPSYRACRIRVSSNNASATDDQTFRDIELTAAGGSATTGTPGSTTSQTASAGGATSSSGATSGESDPASAAASSGSTSPGRLAFTGAQIVLLERWAVALVVAGIAMTCCRRRRALT